MIIRSCVAKDLFNRLTTLSGITPSAFSEAAEYMFCPDTGAVLFAMVCALSMPMRSASAGR